MYSRLEAERDKLLVKVLRYERALGMLREELCDCTQLPQKSNADLAKICTDALYP